MNDAELIASVRSMRKLIMTLDSIGFQTSHLTKDAEIARLVPKRLTKGLKTVTTDIHTTLQKIEKNERYKGAVKRLNVKGLDDD